MPSSSSCPPCSSRAGWSERCALAGGCPAGGGRLLPPILELTEVTKHFGGLAAVLDLDLRLEAGEILGLVGPNGAGKTTVFNLVCDLFPVSRGRIAFEGREITGLKP